MQQPVSLGAGPGLLAQASHALAGATADADDATLLALLGGVVVPALGDVAALYTIGPAGDVRLAGAAPGQGLLTQRLRLHLEQHPGAAASYAALIERGHAAIVPASGPDAAASAMVGRDLGLAAEIAAPLGSGNGHDALLTVGSLDRERRYADADLATVEVLAALVEARRIVRALTHREADLRQQIEEGALAGRELAHRLNNDLTMPVGVVELLLDRGSLGSDLQEMLEAAAKDLAALEQHVRTFHELMRGQSNAPAGPRPPAR